MNVRKPTDYNALFTALDALMAADLPQMKLYCEAGRLVSNRPEKGAAVVAAEYLQHTYPDTAGSSPRNLRRMRDFYRAYESVPEIMAEAMTIGWTQNVVILEAELTLQEKAWYIRAVQRFGWSKLELTKQIASAAHLEIPLDLRSEVCYTEGNNGSECVNDDENPLYLPCLQKGRLNYTPKNRHISALVKCKLGGRFTNTFTNIGGLNMPRYATLWHDGKNGGKPKTH